MRIRDLLTKKRFDAWLVSKKPEDQVGLAGYCESCPIVCYLVEVGNIYLPEITDEITYYLVKGATTKKRYPLPVWAGNFVMEIDTLGDGEEVRAETALFVLRKRELPEHLVKADVSS